MENMISLGQRLGDLLDRLLDRVTTYRLVLYILLVYIAAAVGLSFGNKVAFSPRQIIVSTLWILLISWVINKLLAKIFKVPANQESYLITGLILAMILNPLTSNSGYLTLAAATASAVASKFVITFRGRHIFNPAAFGAFISIIAFHSYASWWIGTKPMFPLLVIGGLLILRKMKRFLMVGAFVYVYAFLIILSSPFGHAINSLTLGLTATSLLFFATAMLTEPLTSPTSLNKSLIYAVLTGTLYSLNRLHFAPEEALLAGNFVTFLMSPSRSQVLHYLGQRKEAEQIFSYFFRTTRPLAFRAGQYMEWTLPGVPLDSRGNRRYLTIASSPTEKEVMLTIKHPDKASGFKVALSKMHPGGQVLAAQLAGDFVLPKQLDTKLAFIAGGVGITPFRSMIKYMLDKGAKTDVKFLYSVNSQAEIAFRDLFEQAKSIGLETFYVVTKPGPGWRGLSGFINEGILQKTVPDFYERLFYISGPQAFVAAVRQALTRLGVERSKIITDFFPGYN